MVTFLATSSRRGNVKAIGPVTGLEYLITPHGTPVNNYDVPGLLQMTGLPCCGNEAPFSGMVKLFGMTSASADQLRSVPEHIMNAKPMPKVKKEPVVEPKREDNVVRTVSRVVKSEEENKVEKQED